MMNHKNQISQEKDLIDVIAEAADYYAHAAVAYSEGELVRYRLRRPNSKGKGGQVQWPASRLKPGMRQEPAN